MADQITIVVEDSIANKNAGIVDENQVSKQVYNKSQTDARIVAASKSNNVGVANKTDVIPFNKSINYTVLDAGIYPNFLDENSASLIFTNDEIKYGNAVIYVEFGVSRKDITPKVPLNDLGLIGVADPKPTFGDHIAKAKEPGTYTNFGGIVVTSAELLANDVYIQVKDGVVSRFDSEKAKGLDGADGLDGDPSKFTKWVAQSYTELTPIEHEGKYYIVGAGKTALATDIPGVSDVWGSIGSDENVNKVLRSFIETSTTVVDDIYPSNYNSFGYIKDDFSILVDSTGVYTSFETEGRDFLNFEGELIRIGAPDIPNYWGIYGVRPDGTKEGLKRPSPLDVYYISETFNVSTFKTIFISLSKFANALPSVSLYNKNNSVVEEDSVLQKIEAESKISKDILEFFIDGTERTGEIKPDLSQGVLEGVLLKIEDLSEVADGAHARLKAFTKGKDYVYFKGYPARSISAVDTVNYATVVGIKANGDKVVLEKAFLSSFTDKIEREYSVSNFVEVYFYVRTGAGLPEVLFYNKKEVGTVEDYIKNEANFKGDEFIFVDRPNYVPIVNLIGEFPADLTSTVNMIMEFRKGNHTIFRTPITNKVQGSSTIYHPKKNWGVKMLNDENKKVKMKFGKWAPDDSFHLKAFFNDRTLNRDTTGNKIMASILESRPYPENVQRSSFNYYSATDRTKTNLMDDGDFYLDGFPIELRINNAFHGMYIWRQRRKNDVYRMDSANKKNIFLANSNLDALRLGQSFNAAQWEVVSPKMTGYEENGAIPDATVSTDVNRLFEWMKSMAVSSTNFNAEVGNYLVVNNLIDITIGLQLNGIWDYYSNNLNIVSNDGLIWRFFAHDMDWGSGIHNYITDAGTETQVKKLYWGGYYLNDYFWRDVIYPKILTALKVRYTELRNSGVISLKSIYKIVDEIPSLIGSEAYDKDMEKWTVEGINNDKGVHSTAYLMQFYKWKLEYLDLIWLLP